MVTIKDMMRPWATFLLTWLSYAGLYLTRKNLSAVKGVLVREGVVSLETLSTMDVGYLLAYSISMVPAGMAVDNGSPVAVLVAGLVGSSLATIALPYYFGLGSFWGVFIAFSINGMCQAAGWPSTAKLMSNRYPASQRVAIMGLWSTNYQLGGVFASMLAGYLSVAHSWKMAFYVPAQVLLCIAGCCLLFLQDSPEEETVKTEKRTDVQVENPIIFLCHSIVVKHCSVYVAIKLVRYSLLFWLPFYLASEHGYEDDAAAYLSTLIEIGGSVGVVVIGFFCQKFNVAPGHACSGFLLCLAVVMCAYAATPSPFLLPFIGFFLYGPDSLIVGAIGQNLAGPRYAGSLCALINGVGSLGAFAQGYLTPVITQSYGWTALFHLFSLSSLCASVVLLLPTPSIVLHAKTE
eukprot:TRINITY_DN4806_c0_g1_i1.p1 TRINITY_DN4806_c0_g1~~TRINITY_DN4806_c0_g1_i1.p1  ORF type:complete len:405 (+),score=47.17 TRINITY_DN4806_c0_g1_i1:42-1256(+)